MTTKLSTLVDIWKTIQMSPAVPCLRAPPPSAPSMLTRVNKGKGLNQYLLDIHDAEMYLESLVSPKAHWDFYTSSEEDPLGVR